MQRSLGWVSPRWRFGMGCAAGAAGSVSAVLCSSGPEEERAEQHVGPFPPAPPFSSPRRRRLRLAVAERSHARAGILPHPQTGEAHQEETLREHGGAPCLGAAGREGEQSCSGCGLHPCAVPPGPCGLSAIARRDAFGPRRNLTKVLLSA